MMVWLIGFFLFISSSFQIDCTQLVLQNSATSPVDIDDFIKSRNIPGLSLAIDDHTEAYGYSNNFTQEILRPEDRFRLASVSKTITAVTIMHLVDLGHVNLSSKIFGSGSILEHDYGQKPYTNLEKQITVQNLLEHTSGFVDNDMCGKECDPTWTPEYRHFNQWELVSFLIDEFDPTHRPGTFASYSNFGYFILGRIVEKVTGFQKYEDYVRQNVLKPIGIDDMRIGTNKRRNNEVFYHDNGPDSPYNFHVSRRDSVGAWIATPLDLLTIIKSILGFDNHKQFLSNKSLEIMFEKSSVNGSNYGKGWDFVNESMAWKDGSYPGTSSTLLINFEKKISYAVVTNTGASNQSGFRGSYDLRDLMHQRLSVLGSKVAGHKILKKIKEF